MILRIVNLVGYVVTFGWILTILLISSCRLHYPVSKISSQVFVVSYQIVLNEFREFVASMSNVQCGLDTHKVFDLICVTICRSVPGLFVTVR